jgi:hypothetical protein
VALHQSMSVAMSPPGADEDHAVRLGCVTLPSLAVTPR